jgi:hypothetical protein
MPAPTMDLETPATPGAATPDKSQDTTSDKAAPRGPAHIAEQRVDADPLPPTDEAGKTDPAPASAKKHKAKNGEDAAAKSRKATKRPAAKGGKSTPEGAQPNKRAEDSVESKASVPGVRLSTYAEEAAELLAGLSANRRRRKPGSDEPAAGQEPGEAQDAD